MKLTPRNVFFLVGLFCSLGAVFSAYEYRTTDQFLLCAVLCFSAAILCLIGEK